MKTSFKYIGDVVFKLKIKDKIITTSKKNSGTIDLSKLFAKFISNNSIDAEELPQFLDLRKNEENVYSSILSSKIPLSGRNYQFDTDTNNWVAIFVATINYSYLVDGNIDQNDPDFRLYITSGYVDGKTIDLAYIDISATELSKIQAGVQGIVEWHMQLK